MPELLIPDPYALFINKLESKQYKDQLIIGFDASNAISSIKGDGNILVKVGDKLVATELKHNYQSGQNFLTIDMDELIAELSVEGITLNNGQTIEIFGKKVAVNTSYTQANLANATQEAEVLAKCAEIDRLFIGDGIVSRSAVYDETSRELKVTLTANGRSYWGTKKSFPVNAYMVLSDGKVHQIKIGEIKGGSQMSTSRYFVVSLGRINELVSKYECNTGLQGKGVFGVSSLEIEGDNISLDSGITKYKEKDDVTVYVHGIGLPQVNQYYNSDYYSWLFPNENEIIETVAWYNSEDIYKEGLLDDIEDLKQRWDSLNDYYNLIPPGVGIAYHKIKNVVKSQLITIFNNKVKGRNRKFSIIAHSLGGQIVFECLNELATERPDIIIDRFITLTPAINTFSEHTHLNDGVSVAPKNIHKWFNIYSIDDIFGGGFRKGIKFNDESVINIATDFDHGGTTSNPGSYCIIDEIYRGLVE